MALTKFRGGSMGYKPTDEQQRAIELFGTGDPLVVEAYAGTGKTSTLQFLANSDKKRSGLYVAFNKAIVTEAGSKMPPSVTCSTAHSLAYRAVGNRYRDRLQATRRMRNQEVAALLGIRPIKILVEVEDEMQEVALPPAKLASLVMRGIRTFCNSADLVPEAGHIPYIDGIDRPRDGRRTYDNNRRVAAELIPAMRKAWNDLNNVQGALSFGHDHYLKIYALGNPKIAADYILFDEAQDASPVMLGIVAGQTDAQVVYVGDSQQQIYSWRGAINALGRAAEGDGVNRTYLSQSFRFGNEVANVANQILEMLGVEIPLKGFDKVESRVGAVENPHCILARTNAGALNAFLHALETGLKPHLVGGGKELEAFAKAAKDLMDGRGTSHPDLWSFQTWDQVIQYVEEDEEGQDLKLMVKLVNEYGADTIVNSLFPMPTERQADLVVSTAHKSKGREWSSVQLMGDFPSMRETQTGAEELRLMYVAVTRAKDELDIDAIQGPRPRKRR